MEQKDFFVGVPFMLFMAFSSAFFVLWLVEFMVNIFTVGYKGTVCCYLLLSPSKAELYFRISAGWAAVCGAYACIRHFRGNR